MKIKALDNKGKHEARTYRKGEWIVFKCDQCPGWGKAFHSDGRVESKGESEYLHYGMNILPDLNEGGLNLFFEKE